MATPSISLRFLQSRTARVVTALLVLQAALLYGFSRSEPMAQHTPLQALPSSLGNWTQVGEMPLDKETLEILKADDTLNRSYANASGAANLFVAFFKSQRYGQAPHSPKNCLPGSGWVPSMSDTITFDVPDRPVPIQANRYVVAKGEAKSLVLYWYQSRDRTVASEYTAKFYVVADAIRYNRTDTALVRVVVPLQGGDVNAAQQTAIEFVRAFYSPLRRHFPA